MPDFRSLTPFGRLPAVRGGLDPFANLQDEMNRLLDRFGENFPSSRRQQNFNVPKVDVAETEAGLELTAELPGFDEKDVSLEINEGVLTIKAEHSEEHETKDEKKHYHLVERTSGSFQRRLALPFEPDADKATAHLEKGLLKVFVPRAAGSEKRPKSIPVEKGPATAGTTSSEATAKGATGSA